MSDRKPIIGILASTNATIMPSIVHECQKDLNFAVLITDKEYCGAREKARILKIPDVFLSPIGLIREEWDQKCVQELRKYNVELVILIGFMRVLSPVFVNAFKGKILNVHPSLLPKHGGGMNLDVHRAVLEAGERETGATIHVVTNELDAGPIVVQRSVIIEKDDTPETLKGKVQKIEAQIYPEAIRKALKNS